MCGIVAVLGKGADKLVHDALPIFEHRGIRGKGIDTPVGSMGHVRLPIVGLGTEYDQPIKVGNRWVLGFVGELLNFKDFDSRLQSDIQMVERTWMEHGPSGFTKFDGFWSIVAMDTSTQSLHLVTDYLNQKPMYYRSDDIITAVASEPDTIGLLAPVSSDPIYMASVIKWGYCPETWRTPYLEVRRTQPGEHTLLKEGQPPISRITDPLVPEKIFPSELKLRIEQAVKRRVMSSDVEVSALVSGGLDSAITHQIASRYADIKTYHVENGEKESIDKLLLPNEYMTLDHDQVSVDKAISYMQEPMDLGSLYPQIALSDAIGSNPDHERVCLTGDGADELFGGYGRAALYDSQYSDVYHELIGYHLPRLDRVMMRNAIEIRTPFLARQVARAALGLKREFRIDKKVLRDLFRNDLPTGVADTPKKPLRTQAVEDNRQGSSIALVNEFMKRWEV